MKTADDFLNEIKEGVHHPNFWKAVIVAMEKYANYMIPINKKIEEEKDSQDELWNEILELFYEQDCGIDKLREQFIISKKVN